MELTDDDYVGATEPRGAAGSRRLTFRVRDPGSGHLRLVRRRAWESVAVEEFAVDLDAMAD